MSSMALTPLEVESWLAPTLPEPQRLFSSRLERVKHALAILSSNDYRQAAVQRDGIYDLRVRQNQYLREVTDLDNTIKNRRPSLESNADLDMFSKISLGDAAGEYNNFASSDWDQTTRAKFTWEKRKNFLNLGYITLQICRKTRTLIAELVETVATGQLSGVEVIAITDQILELVSQAQLQYLQSFKRGEWEISPALQVLAAISEYSRPGVKTKASLFALIQLPDVVHVKRFPVEQILLNNEIYFIKDDYQKFLDEAKAEGEKVAFVGPMSSGPFFAHLCSDDPANVLVAVPRLPLKQAITQGDQEVNYLQSGRVDGAYLPQRADHFKYFVIIDDIAAKGDTAHAVRNEILARVPHAKVFCTPKADSVPDRPKDPPPRERLFTLVKAYRDQHPED
jgi:adenine/guanine phosphoribosyltransferase-like PRPP-binding protein